MSILVDSDIRFAIDHGVIKIKPFDEEALGTNSYDVHLAQTLRVYEPERVYMPDRPFTAEPAPVVLDCRAKPRTRDIVIPRHGYVLQPGILYLASTTEYTESHQHVPVLNGKSSIGRLGLSIHVTAGFGDVGFCNYWTMELFVIHPLRVYAGMPIGQLMWYEASGRPAVKYGEKPSAKYNEISSVPMPSEMAKNFRKP